MKRITKVRLNVLILAGIAAAVVGIVAWAFGSTHPELVITLAAGFVGGCVAALKDLITPDPPEEPPAPKVVPLEAHLALIDHVPVPAMVAATRHAAGDRGDG